MIDYNTQFLDKPITFIAVPHGRDYAISIMGGDKFHIGAIAFCIPGSVSSVASVHGHKEEALALQLASSISRALNCVISVSIGIHFDNITASQINNLISIVNTLKDGFIDDCSKGSFSTTDFSVNLFKT
jgi:hypothetical protein